MSTATFRQPFMREVFIRPLSFHIQGFNGANKLAWIGRGFINPVCGSCPGPGGIQKMGPPPPSGAMTDTIGVLEPGLGGSTTYYTILYDIIPHDITLSHIVLYYTILCYTIPYYTGSELRVLFFGSSPGPSPGYGAQTLPVLPEPPLGSVRQ